MTAWSDVSRKVIAEVHKTLPEKATYLERKKALSAAYPFGPREMWPYKTWLKQCKNYLAAFKPRDPAEAAKLPMSPLERMMVKAKSETQEPTQ